MGKIIKKILDNGQLISTTLLLLNNVILLYLQGYYKLALILVICGILGFLLGSLIAIISNWRERIYYKKNILNPMIEFNRRRKTKYEYYRK